jgi:hypothetical protein
MFTDDDACEGFRRDGKLPMPQDPQPITKRQPHIRVDHQRILRP